jgi:hypothetical protein
MFRVDYANNHHTLQSLSQNCHGLQNDQTRSRCCVHVSGLEIAEIEGDGVHLRWAKDISMGGVTTQGAYRNGLSVIGTTDLLVSHCTFANTDNVGRCNEADTLTPMNDGTAPRAGVDIEPNGNEEMLLNITFRDCVATGNDGNVWDTSTVTNHSIVFERCARAQRTAQAATSCP